MNACSVKTLLVTAATTVMMIVGCASADPSVDEAVLTEVETDNVDPTLKTGARISSSSGVIGGVGGTIVKDPAPSTDNIPPSCPGTCELSDDWSVCHCPGGYDTTSTPQCPLSAPNRRYVLGKWRCYSF